MADKTGEKEEKMKIKKFSFLSINLDRKEKKDVANYIKVCQAVSRNFPSINFTTMDGNTVIPDDNVWETILGLVFGEESPEGLKKIQDSLSKNSYDGKWSGRICLTTNKNFFCDETEEEVIVKIIPYSSKEDEGRIIKLVASKSSCYPINNQFKLIVDYGGRCSFAHLDPIVECAKKISGIHLKIEDVEINQEEEEFYMYQGLLPLNQKESEIS